MPTHPLGPGTANLSINVPIDEHRLLSRLAFLAIERGEARSNGDFQRQLIARGLEAHDPEAAAKLREIRSRYYATTLAALLAGASVFQWLGLSDDSSVARRSSSGVRIVRNFRRLEMEEAV